MHYTGTIWRPPYEAYSALVQVTAGCTHHKCKFCTLYEDVPFKFRMSPLSEIEEDLKEISRYHRNAKRVFFTGANPFVLSFDKLKTLAELVKKYYPKVQSIGCFARITDITPKTTEQLAVHNEDRDRTYSESWTYHIIAERLIAYKYGRISEVQVQNIEKNLSTIIQQFEEMKKDLVFLLSENGDQQN